MVLVVTLLVVGWVAASVIGTQAYFRGEQRKPIHSRNWNSDSFDTLSESITGTPVDYSDRELPNGLDAYGSAQLSQ